MYEGLYWFGTAIGAGVGLAIVVGFFNVLAKASANSKPL